MRRSSNTIALGLGLAFASGLGALFSTGAVARADLPVPSPSASPADRAHGVDDFLAIAQVMHSPRCQNCHPNDGRPRVGDAGRRHRMNVSRASMTSGLPCTTCHRTQNAPVPHSPPGIPGEPGWRMPGAENPMVFDGRSPHELCEQLKDPARNGGKSLDELREHFAHDPLVVWAWAPGPERTLPPITHEQLLVRVEGWVAAGAPCPP